ncbi:DKNYY domain-containing protein [Flavobacterium selenitireducens]|uniref:DKNYY domain-containing protein n=1 Tax=Flavobacterium selenitireducens TaxID=2722704 RepID=UPI00168B85F7|nr:DKNYY domain-containing protein [Flavobacterium selenitireducens]MBD3584021.1 hypothetical protein [Flavobacterium selenitireducens]
MKQLFYFLSITFLFIGCKEEYIVKGNQVYHKGWNEGVGNYERLLDGADAKTFVNLKYSGVNAIFGKDKFHVYMDGKIVPYSDSKTFKYISDHFFKDKNSIYFFGFYSSEQDWKIDSIVPSQFKLIKYPWATDGKSLIWGYKTLEVDDLSSFKPLNENWAKTKDKVIFQAKVLNNVDYDSFEVIDDYNAQDKNGKVFKF